MTELVILKLGGSAITDKARNQVKAKTALIRRAAKEIKAAQKKKDFKLILVHGAGPFGHKFVKDYGINHGIKTEKQVQGFVLTHQSVAELNKIVVDIFQREGLLAFPLQPSACIVQENKRIVEFRTKIMEELFKVNPRIIPVFYGDMVVDQSLKASVVSGDAIVPFLAKRLNANRILLGGDVKGIYTADPKKDRKAKLIPKINNQNYHDVLQMVSGSKAVDVTGGMKGKLSKLLETAGGKKTLVFDLRKKDNLFKALKGEKFSCTEIF